MKVINAYPTKQLFIDMLTRDISLEAAILDLVDNSADGARRLRFDKSYEDLFINIEISDSAFIIRDNCGGIPIDVAEKYAFRFGRPEEAGISSGSVGRFGVGMKRAIFKLGRHFLLESKTPNESFSTDVNINKWATIPEWEFPFTTIDEKAKNPAKMVGTTITITKLLDGPKNAFNLPTFASEIIRSIKKYQNNSLRNKLHVSVNGKTVTSDPIELLSSPKLAPAEFNKQYRPKNSAPVNVLLYCGLGPSTKVADAGWHVYCNSRLILKGDKTEITGWNSEGEDGTEIPSFHGQFNMVRGYAYFDSIDAAALPWNTTKTGLNPDSDVFRSVRQEMIMLMRPLVDFCNRLKEEKEAETDRSGPLTKLVSEAEPEEIETIQTRAAFKIPSTVAAKTGPRLQKIAFDKPEKEAEKVKMHLDAKSWREVGEAVFDYYVSSEME